MVKTVARVITVDGPAGVGKGTLAQRLAAHLGWSYLDSGAYYRLLAWAGAGNEAEAIDLLARLSVEFRPGPEGMECWVDGRPAAIRSEAVAAAASQLAASGPLRAALTEKFRSLAAVGDLVADGRDMGTVVFPTAFLKIYLTASAEVRAQRRLNQLQDSAKNININKLVDEIRQRDERDSTRSIAPLKPASDAVVIDTSSLSREQVFQQVLRLI